MKKSVSGSSFHIALLRLILAVGSICGSVSIVMAGEADCGVVPQGVEGSFGPFDYRDPTNHVRSMEHPMGRLKRVENVHFQAQMKALNLKRYTVEELTAEFAYTLRAFPNHPEALYAMSRLERVSGRKLPQKAASQYPHENSAECFFDRAVRFRPDDGQVRFVYAMHLHGLKQLELAREQYAVAEKLGVSTPNFYYNYGLVLSDLRDWEAARGYAQKAYAGGFSLQGLRQRLTAAGFPP